MTHSQLKAPGRTAGRYSLSLGHEGNTEEAEHNLYVVFKLNIHELAENQGGGGPVGGEAFLQPPRHTFLLRDLRTI